MYRKFRNLFRFLQNHLLMRMLIQ